MSADGDLKTLHRAIVEMYAGRADKALAGSALEALARVRALVAEARASRKVAPSPRAPVEDARPMLTEWYDVPMGAERKEKRGNGPIIVTRQTNGYRWRVWEPQSTRQQWNVEGFALTLATAKAAADTAARQWYRLPEDAHNNAPEHAGRTHHGSPDECGCKHWRTK